MARGVRGQGRRVETAPLRRTPEAVEISRIAYKLWIKKGCRSGCDLEDWLEAEALVRGKASAGPL